MNFGESIEAMKAGKRVCRKGWENKWLAINNLEYDCPSFIYLGMDNAANAAIDKVHLWTPTQSEMMAEDWEIKPETQKVNNGMNGLLYFSLLLFALATKNLNEDS